MAERFNINDERSFYLAGIKELSEKITDMDKLRLAYEFVRSAWMTSARERNQKNEDKWNCFIR